MSRPLRLLLLLALCVCLPAPRICAQDLDLGGGEEAGGGGDMLDEELSDLADELGSKVGAVPVRLVRVDAPDQTIPVYWRELPGLVAAQTYPAEVRVAGSVAIGPKQVALEQDMGMETHWAPSGEVEIPNGKSVLQPGKIEIRRTGNTITVDHPALRLVDGELRVLCAPVSFRVGDGALPLPKSFFVSSDSGMLLRQTGLRYSALTVWLPVGLSYRTPWGSFSLAADGTLADLRLEDQVSADGQTLVHGGAAEPTPAQGERGNPGRALVLWPHAGRGVFARGEQVHLYVFAPAGFGGGEVTLRHGDRDLTTLTLAAAPAGGWSTGGVRLDMHAFPSGTNAISATAAGVEPAAPWRFELVEWRRRSDFLVHTMSCCTDPWPTNEAGLALLHEVGLEMVTSTGHSSLLDTRRPTLGPPKPGQPVETAWQPTGNDRLLERMLAHRLRMIDLTVARGANLYNEGLSYHHSYKPSVDRMIRRMSIFTQQTGEFPSFWGVNYSWFPRLEGYVEGGVPTDAHRKDRMDALNAYLAEQGIVRPERDDRRWLRQLSAGDSPEDQARIKDVIARELAWWRGANERGFAYHNALYNAAIRQIRPETTTVLFDNAGHDHNRPARSQFHDMAAVTYESYTDYGEWPMSAGFTTDWARGTAPGMPVWLTTDWGTSTEGGVKSLFHAIIRGLDGGGSPMQEKLSPDELRRRGRALQLAGMYGSVTKEGQPDARVGIFATLTNRVADGRAGFACHAIYYHLTRLGFPAVIVDAEDRAIPDSVQVLWLVRQTVPLDADEVATLDAYRARGGTLLVTGDSVQIPGAATRVGGVVNDIWKLSGFMPTVHGEMWAEFEQSWRRPLAEAMAATGLAPRAVTDPDRALALTLDAGAVRYAFVASDVAGSHARDVAVLRGLPVAFAGEGWHVRDLVHQTDLATRDADGQTHVTLDLISEPLAFLALYRDDPTAMQVSADATGITVQADPGLPLRIRLLRPDGTEQDRVYRAPGHLDFLAPAVGQAGPWTVEVQEMLTGRVARGQWTPATYAAPAAAPIPAVEIADARQLREFQAIDAEKVIVLEPEQRHLRPVADALLQDLQAAGVAARIWQLTPADFDSQPTRWYMRPEDDARLALIHAGTLIGMRRDLQPYIDTDTRSHVPQRGGYHSIDPPWMLDRHAILFSGGRLAESLRAVTNWLPTANLPGPGQGRLLVCFSPFMANRHVAVVCGPDYAAAATVLATSLAPEPAVAAATTPGTRIADTGDAVAAVETPLVGLRPWERVDALYSAGETAVLQVASRSNTIVTVAADGSMQAWVDQPEELTIAADGRVWTATQRGDQVWLEGSRDGTVERRILAHPELPRHIPLNRSPEASFQVSPDGGTVFLGRLGGAWIGDLTSGDWRFYDDIPSVWLRPEVWTPRFPVGVSFSPDGRYVFFTMECRPTGSTNMSGISFTPVGTEAVLLDTRSLEKVWSKRLEPTAPDALILGMSGVAMGLTNLRFDTHSGFAAVAVDGQATALADFAGDCLLLAKDGRLLARQPYPWPETLTEKSVRYNQWGPPDGVGVAIATDGSLAAWGFTNRLVLGNAEGLHTVALDGLRDVTVTRDGALVVAALANGEIRAYGPDGALRWSTATGGGFARLAPRGTSGVFAARIDATLMRLDAAGKPAGPELQVATAIDAPARALDTATAQVLVPPLHYREPETLAVAKSQLGATRLDGWEPVGDVSMTIGEHAFRRVDGAIELPADDAPTAFLHLVYRRPEGAGPLQVTLTQGRAKRSFELDLPTPSYRVLDLPIPAGWRVSVTAKGPWEAAACERWRFTWPGANLALIRSDSMAAGLDVLDQKEPDNGIGGLDLDGDGPAGTSGFKDVAIYAWNPDPDKVAGTYLPPGTGPLRVVDGRVFETDGGPPWCSGKDLIGPWFTVQFKRPRPTALVATADREDVQSRVVETLSIFTGFDAELNRDSGRVLNAAIENDQFWRLFALPMAARAQIGVHISGDRAGLREVEVYGPPER